MSLNTKVRVVHTDRFHLREITKAVLHEFSVVVVFDGAFGYDQQDSPGSLASAEIDAFVDYNYNGHPLVLIAGGYENQAEAHQKVVKEIFDGIQPGVTIGGDSFKSGNGLTLLKSGSGMRVEAGGGEWTENASLKFSGNYYPKRHHVRRVNGQSGVRMAYLDGLSASSIDVDQQTVISPAAGAMGGIWTNLIVFDGISRAGGGGDGTEDVLHAIWEPTWPQGGVGPAPQGSRPGRIVFDGALVNFRTSNESGANGHPGGDQIRLLADAIIWANEGSAPESVLVYNTAGHRLGSGSSNIIRSFPENRGIAGIGRLLEAYLALPLPFMGNGT